MPNKTAIAALRSKPGMPELKPALPTGRMLTARNLSEVVYDTYHDLPHGARQAVLHSLLELGSIAADRDPLWYEKLLRGQLVLIKKGTRNARD